MSSKNNAKGYVGVYEFARETKQALNTVYQQIYLHKLPAEKIGRKWQIKKSVLLAHQAANGQVKQGGGERMSIEQYIESRIKRQESLMSGATENGREWRAIIINELKEVLIHLRQTQPEGA